MLPNWWGFASGSLDKGLFLQAPLNIKKEMVMLPSELLHAHREEVLTIMGRYPMVSGSRVIGSVARGEDTPESDIDFFIDTAPETTLFDIGGLHEDLEDLLGVPVNIITSGGRIHDYMRMAIERDARAI